MAMPDRLTIVITQADIDNGYQRNPSMCPVTFALRRDYRGIVVDVEPDLVELYYEHRSYLYRPTDTLAFEDWLERFDHNRADVEPCAFELVYIRYREGGSMTTHAQRFSDQFVAAQGAFERYDIFREMLFESVSVDFGPEVQTESGSRHILWHTFDDNSVAATEWVRPRPNEDSVCEALRVSSPDEIHPHSAMGRIRLVLNGAVNSD